jgi:hypothetical protein
MANVPKPTRKLTVELPPWAHERLTSAARNRRIGGPEAVASLLIVSRLARGSLDQDLRGLLGGMNGVRTFHDETFVKELLD